MTLVKVCGLVREDDVDAAVDAGADLIGLILVEWSPRAVTPAAAERLRARVPSGVGVVGVVADRPVAEVERLRDALALDHVQLHGSEPEEDVARLGDAAIQAHRLPLDGAVYGGTVLLDRPFGSVPDRAALEAHWAVARAEGARRRVVLAGALDPGNVAAAVRAARPWAVDAVRGTESAPGVKDHDRLRAFVRAAKEAQA